MSGFIFSIFSFLLFVFTAGFVSLAIAAVSFAPWVPAKRQDIERIISLARIKDGQSVYDLGCGNGSVLIETAKKYKVRAVGFELAWPMYLVCIIRKKISKFNGVLEFKMKNFFKQNLSGADVVYFFGIPETISRKLKPKLEKELRPGTRVVSYVFPVNGWEPEITDSPPGRNSIYLYIKK